MTDLLRSKRFWIGVVGLVFMVVVQLFPEVAGRASDLQELALWIIGILIGGYSLQDAASAWNGKNKYLDE